MAVGIKAFYMILAMVLSLSMLAGMGVPGEMGVQYQDGYDEDVQEVVDAMTSQEQPNTGTSTFADFTIGGGRALQTGWEVITNTDAVLILLTGMPRPAATGIQAFFTIAFGLSFAQFIRGVVLN